MNGSSRGVEYLGFNNPDAPYFAIKIQDKIFDIDINFIESLTIERSVDSFGNFAFTIVNVMDVQFGFGLEEKLMALITSDDNTDGTNISMQYGWNKGLKSRWFSGRVFEYRPTFMPDGYMKFEVTGNLVKCGEDVIEQVKAYRGTSISEIVREISEDMGWLIEEIEPTVPLSEPLDFRLTNVRADDYIRTELEPQAYNAKKEPFRFVLDSYDNQNHVYFVSANKSIAKGSVQKNFNFFINAGNYGSVLSWSPSYQGSVVSGMVMDSPIFDSNTNDIVVYGSDSKIGAKGGPGLTVYGSTTPDRMEALLANKWFNTNVAGGAIQANMEIVGDPTVQPQTHVNVLPFDHNGDLHFSGGTYLVQKVTDTISGDYRTSLEMFKAGIDNGTKTMNLTEAVEFKGSE